MTRTVAAALSLLVCTAAISARSQSQEPQPPNPDAHYQLGPDSLPREGVAKGEVRGPFTLPSQAYPGTQHTYWVYVPAQYDPAVPASLMIFNDGQAFKNMEGDLRAPNVLDNLIDRREIPVMLSVFINPGRTPEQPEPTPQEWGDRTTNRPTEYNTLDDKYARVIVDELMPALAKDYNIAKDPERRGIGGASSGAIAAFTVAWQRPNDFRKVLSMIGSFTNLRGGHAYADLVRKQREEADPDLPAGRPQRQPRRRARRQLRREARLVLPERAADAGAARQGLRPELSVGDRAAQPEARRFDLSGHDALALAGSPGLDRREGHGRTVVQHKPRRRRNNGWGQRRRHTGNRVTRFPHARFL